MKKLLLIFVILVLLGACGLGGYWYAKKKLTEENRVEEITQNVDPNTIDTAYTNTSEDEQKIEDQQNIEEESIKTLGELDSESLKKWKGEYYAEYFDEKGKKENKPIVISVRITSPEDANVDIGRKGADKTSQDVSSYFGTFEKMDQDNSSVLFIPQVMSGDFKDSPSGEMEDGFFLQEKDGNFSVKTRYVSKNGNFIEFPIKKIK
jgi:hypothetical protein